MGLDQFDTNFQLLVISQQLQEINTRLDSVEKRMEKIEEKQYTTTTEYINQNGVSSVYYGLT